MQRLPSLTLASPLGPLRLVASDAGLAFCLFRGDEARSLAAKRNGSIVDGTNDHLLASRDWLIAFFDGELDRPRPPLDPHGSEFFRAVWDQLIRIPAGETRSYGGIARALSRPGASRAVGMANGANPIAVIVPCHRVIGSDGKLVGYGGCMPRKNWLLTHERAIPAQTALPL